MLGWISLAVTLLAAWAGFGAARKFVRGRLRYVDAALRPSSALVAGVVSAIVAAPVAWLLPVVTGATAVVFGVAVGLGVRAGASDIKRGNLLPPGR
ncbi:MAG: hypothetical protein IT356_11625 [Gemmatimonadaceae bacterium]|nr:hypothetical protein [Gemmatimonadaceae bacterium]